MKRVRTDDVGPAQSFEGDLKEKGLKRLTTSVLPRRAAGFEGDLKEKGLKPVLLTMCDVVLRFEGDLKEKGLKPALAATRATFPRFEGDLKEKGLKRPRFGRPGGWPVLKET